MCHRVKGMVVVAVCVAACVLSFGLSAANADLVNGSFESPALEENGYRFSLPDDWEGWNYWGYVINGNNASGDGIAGPAEGSQLVEFQGWLGQNTGIPLVSGTTYSVSCQANRGSLTGLNYFRIDLNAADTPNPGADSTTFATQQYTDLTASTWVQKTLSAEYTGDSGKYLMVWFKMDGQYGGLDNVRVIPEPSALGILVTGILGFLAYAWRKRTY